NLMVLYQDIDRGMIRKGQFIDIWITFQIKSQKLYLIFFLELFISNQLNIIVEYVFLKCSNKGFMSSLLEIFHGSDCMLIVGIYINHILIDDLIWPFLTFKYFLTESFHEFSG